MNSLKYKRIETTVRNSPLKNIGTYGRQLPYIETAFSGFDEFLFTGDLRNITRHLYYDFTTTHGFEMLKYAKICRLCSLHLKILNARNFSAYLGILG